MKRFILMIIAILFVSAPLMAQNTKKKLNFIYITHSDNTQTSRLIARLREEYSRVLRMKEPTVFYLTNGRTPLVVQINTERDNRKNFGEIVYQLQTMRSHSVNPPTDIKKIMSLVEELKIDNENGAPLYSKINWEYYVNSSFWKAGYNESIIAKLYWVLDMQQWEKSNYMTLRIYYGEKDPLPINEEAPFGDKNLCAATRFIPQSYR